MQRSGKLLKKTLNLSYFVDVGVGHKTQSARFRDVRMDFGLPRIPAMDWAAYICFCSGK